MISYRSRRLASSFLKRLTRWEFWPMWLFYIPVVVYIIGLTLRYRRLAFTAVNPGMPGSGVIGEKKSDSLLQLQPTCPQHIAKTVLIKASEPFNQQLTQLDNFVHNLGYPVILKPDYGQRGIDVRIIKDRQQALSYLEKATFDTVVQEYVAGVEFGVFYVKQPSDSKGRVFSTTHKCFPHLVGDGISTVEELILKHSRLHYMARYLLNHLDSTLLNMTPPLREKVQVINIGSHCRGSLFLDGAPYLTESVEKQIDMISQQLPEFYFGRYDIRADSIKAFEQGLFKVIEVNGVTSEPTHIYDPKYSVWYAYRILFKQWRLAYVIGNENIQRGFKPMTFTELIEKVKTMNRETPKQFI